MKKYSNYLLVGLCSMALTLPIGEYANASAATNKVEIAGQPVDLTYAAEKADLCCREGSACRRLHQIRAKLQDKDRGGTERSFLRLL